MWNIVNSLLAGAIFFAGSFSATQQITINAVMISGIISLGVALTNFKQYWGTIENHTYHMFKFI